jgi:4-diphosphocytidyl-2-C-methyl-D-erythritol kinase
VITETAFAKINLALHVRRRRDDGYHKLETLFAFVDRGDAVSFSDAECLRLSIDGPFAAPLLVEAAEDNLIFRVGRAMQAHFGVNNGAAIHLTKKLPVASGIGGGSADAAAAARGLNQLWNLGASQVQLIQAVGHLGADIPACIASVSARGEGVGEALTPSGDAVSGIPVLLANPLEGVSTAAVFKRWDGQDRGALAHGDAMAAALSGRNDLETAAAALCPAIAEGLAVLSGTGASLTRMSGSGATIFGMYPDATSRDGAADLFQRHFPHWWTLAGTLR